MKGLSNVIWVAIALVIGIAVLVLVIAPLIRGQLSLTTTVSEADYRNCCSNFRANDNNKFTTECSVPMSADFDNNKDGKVNLNDLCQRLGKVTCDPCSG